MALTVGTGPFGHEPDGKFNFDVPERVLYFEDYPRRIRALFGGETVVDSKRVKLLHETGCLPIYYFPEADVRMDLLERSRLTTHSALKGDADYWSIQSGERKAPNVAWSYPKSIQGAPALAGYVAFHWEPMDKWLEEDEELVGHARDPYHRIDVVETSRRVKVSLRGELLADTSRSRVLFETGLPSRWYIPPDDVRSELLLPSAKHTECAYKGIASYFTVKVGDALEQDLIWYYAEPRHDAARVKNYLCFFNERVDLGLDGKLEQRPSTEWSPGREGRSVTQETAWPGI